MERQGKVKTCWWKTAGRILDYVVPITPQTFATIDKDKKTKQE